MYVRKLKIKEKYHDNHIFAADETVIWVDPYVKTCITNKGAKEVAVQSTGHEKLRITVMLCAKANGDKCLPFVLLPRNRPMMNVEKMFKNKLNLSSCGSV